MYQAIKTNHDVYKKELTNAPPFISDLYRAWVILMGSFNLFVLISIVVFSIQALVIAYQMPFTACLYSSVLYKWFVVFGTTGICVIFCSGKLKKNSGFIDSLRTIIERVFILLFHAWICYGIYLFYYPPNANFSVCLRGEWDVFMMMSQWMFWVDFVCQTINFLNALTIRPYLKRRGYLEENENVEYIYLFTK